MKRRICYILLALSWISLASTHFAPDHVSYQQDQIPSPQQAGFDSKQGHESVEGAYVNEEEANKRVSRVGSRPPNCEHKCEGCIPCTPIQIPTTTDHVALQYANYEPAGWKCKCRSFFFNP